MKPQKVTQDNLYLILPGKVTQIAVRLIELGIAQDIDSALKIIYSSPVYKKMEKENTKYWWLGLNALYEEIIDSTQQTPNPYLLIR